MAKKDLLTEEIERINTIMENSKRISEGLYLNNEYKNEEDNDSFEETPEEEELPTPEVEETPAQPAVIGSIRKMAIQGLANIDDPNSEEYKILKQIWNICDKKPNKEIEPKVN